MQLVMVIITSICTLITACFTPIILKRMDKQFAHNKSIGKQRVQIEEVDMKMTKYSRQLTRETAQAVMDGKSNGSLTKAIENFDKAYDELAIETEKAIQRLKEEYK